MITNWIKAYKFVAKNGDRIHCGDLPTLIAAVVNELEIMDLEEGENLTLGIGCYPTTQESFDALPVMKLGKA